VDYALFAGTEGEKGAAVQLAREATSRGAVVIDNGSDFRLDPEVPLVVPEVNGHLLRPAGGPPGVVANPNCSTILLLVALEPIRRAFGVSRIDVTTYQAVSGAGTAGMDELAESARAELDGRAHSPRVFPEPSAFNVFSHDASVDLATGLNGEEQKIIAEVRRIWDAPDLAICPTCVRVGVFRGHAEAVTVTLAEAARETDVRSVLQEAPGIRLQDDRRRNRFPTPRRAAGEDEVLVGRVRADPSEPPSGGRNTRFALFLAGDQLRKGAALNALQIARELASGR
jgi:aspartate-semialdehyde dehydrogenase